MDAAARLTSKGQLTVPKAVREALRLEEGDTVLFRVDGQRATLARTTDLLDLAGTVDVPTELRGTQWPRIRERTHTIRARKHR